MTLGKNFIHNKIKSVNSNARTLYIGLSGGIDSIVLLNLVVELKDKYDIVAVHVNHGLSNNADSWESFCKYACKGVGVEFRAYNVEVVGSNIEAIAREKRLEIWRDLLQNSDSILLLAHHAQDQAETFLYRLFRGSGITGLSCMQESIELEKGFLLRPLLGINKKFIEEYAKINSLKWIVDESNTNDKFDRNFIRNNLLPLIESRWPHAVNKINNSAVTFRKHRDFVNNYLEEKFIEFAGSRDNTLSVNKILEASDYLRFEVIQKFAKSFGVHGLSTKQIDCLVNEVLKSNFDAKPLYRIFDKDNKYYFTRYKDDLYLFEHNPYDIEVEKIDIEWDLKSPLIVNGKTLIAIGRQDDIAKLGTIRVKVGDFGRDIKKIFQENAIPPWERLFYPVLHKNDKKVRMLVLSEIKINKVIFNFY